ncbi:MAG TPA: hypothetical protein VGR59_00085 [Gemmatimonadaceae bacterium]|nr:hypothetical protein [Gemmatimonadaceae bacterium]
MRFTTQVAVEAQPQSATLYLTGFITMRVRPTSCAACAMPATEHGVTRP